MNVVITGQDSMTIDELQELNGLQLRYHALLDSLTLSYAVTDKNSQLIKKIQSSVFNFEKYKITIQDTIKGPDISKGISMHNLICEITSMVVSNGKNEILLTFNIIYSQSIDIIKPLGNPEIVKHK